MVMLTSTADRFRATMLELGFPESDISTLYRQSVEYEAKGWNLRVELDTLIVRARAGRLLPSSASSLSSADDHGRGASLE